MESEFIAVYIHPKESNRLRSHLRAIMAYDHSRLGLENEFFENKSGQIFCARQVYLQYFTIFQDKLHSVNIQNRTKHTWAFSKTVQKISKITYTASRFSLLRSAKFSVNIKRVTLQHSKEFIVCVFFLI